MTNTIISCAVEIAATLLITLIGVLGAWLTAQIGKSKKLSNIGAATEQLIFAAQTTVGELQQTLVNGLKAANANGKLTDVDVKVLKDKLITMTIEKLSGDVINVLTAASVDVDALIRGAGEDWILRIKEA